MVDGLVLVDATLVSEPSRGPVNVVIVDDRIEAVGAEVKGPPSLRKFDCSGLWIGPSFVDLHTHTRLPGAGLDESPESLTRSALLGGFTTMVALANTNPPVDRMERVLQARQLFRTLPVEVVQAACVTMEREGERLVDFRSLWDCGVEVFSDDGSVVPSALLMRDALSWSHRLGVIVAEHAQDPSLGSPGYVNAGVVAQELGMVGMPESAESVVVARDLVLQREVGGRLHLMHLSAPESLLVVEALARGRAGVTTEVTPHHLLFSDEHLRSEDTNYKVNPPLRSENSRVQLVDAALRGWFDVVATDHAPHAPSKKNTSFVEAAFGLIGMQSAFSATLTALLARSDVLEDDPIEREHQVVGRVFQLLADGPRRLLGRSGGIRVGLRADIAVVDPWKCWTLQSTEIASLSQNSPYVGHNLTGKVFGLIDGGVVKVWNGSLEIDVKRG